MSGRCQMDNNRKHMLGNPPNEQKRLEEKWTWGGLRKVGGMGIEPLRPHVGD